MNHQHSTTFAALFKLFGLSEEGAQEISRVLAYIDNGVQDSVIAILASELAKRQHLLGEPKQK